MFSVHVDGDLFIALALEAMLVAEACAVACARNGGVLHKPPGFPCPAVVVITVCARHIVGYI